METDDRKVVASVSGLSIKTKPFKIFAHSGGIINENSIAYEVAETEFSFSKEDAGKWFRISLLIVKDEGVGFKITTGDLNTKYQRDLSNPNHEDIGFIISGRIAIDGTKFEFYDITPIVIDFFTSGKPEVNKDKHFGKEKLSGVFDNDTITHIPITPQIRRTNIKISKENIPSLDVIKTKKWDELNLHERALVMRKLAEQSDLVRK